MVLDNFYPDENTDGYRIAEFLNNRMAREIGCDRGVVFITPKELEERLRVFQMLLEGPIFAKGRRNRIKTFKLNDEYLDAEKREKLELWITEIR
jgi:hypothetical protein